jgi:hypothetical protein
MDSHPDPNDATFGPLVRRQRPLCVEASRDRCRCIGKGNKKTVALRLDLEPAVTLERASQQPAVVFENIFVPLPQSLEKSRRTLDIRKQKRDEASGQIEVTRRS